MARLCEQSEERTVAGGQPRIMRSWEDSNYSSSWISVEGRHGGYSGWQLVEDGYQLGGMAWGSCVDEEESFVSRTKWRSLNLAVYT